MTLFLAIEAATDIGSVAVGVPGAPAAEVVIGKRRHAADLVPAVEETLRLAGASWKDLSGLVVADGPGSFTGLRIAFATALGIVRERTDLSVFTVPSLLGTALLGAQFGTGPVAAMYDALRGEVYTAVCDFAGTARVVLSPVLTTVDRLVEDRVVARLAIGDGAGANEQAVRSWTGRAPIVPPAGAPRASMLIELVGMGLATPVADVSAWEPSYGRPAEAQARWERAHGRALPGTIGG